MTPVLYVTRNGLLEPLGQSQVLAYLRGLSAKYRVTLISFEKSEDWADVRRVAETRAECDRLGIRWVPRRFLAGHKIFGPALGTLLMVWLVWREVRAHRVRLVHARSYIPALAALLVSRVTGVPFIFDMRALWPEELITAGRLRRGSALHKAIAGAERICLRRASGVVSLTHAAVEHLRQKYARELATQRVVVIPTCADLERFRPRPGSPSARVIGCVGTVLSGWFRLEWLAAFFAVAARRDPNITFEVTTRDDPSRVREGIGGGSDLQARLRIAASPSDRVQQVLQRQIASVMFFTDGLGKMGSSPTRMGEILGCGLPIVANDGVGDVARIIRQFQVGVLAAGSSSEDMEAAWAELQRLLLDPELGQRCRKAAEHVFSLETGTAAYLNLYDDILGERRELASAGH